jgi:hypothetical protein
MSERLYKEYVLETEVWDDIMLVLRMEQNDLGHFNHYVEIERATDEYKLYHESFETLKMALYRYKDFERFLNKILGSE